MVEGISTRLSKRKGRTGTIHSLRAATDKGKSREQSRSFLYPPGGCAVLEIGCRRPTISHTYTPTIFSCVFFGKQSECKQNASNFDDVLMTVQRLDSG